jgi:hypothetical protein
MGIEAEIDLVFDFINPTFQHSIGVMLLFSADKQEIGCFGIADVKVPTQS